MNEAQRQFAMGFAGVRLWYARGPLPGAAPSPEFDFPAPDVPASVEAAAEPSAAPHGSGGDKSHRGLRRIQGLLAETRREPARALAPPEPEIPVAPVTAAAPAETPREPEPESQAGPDAVTRASLAGEVVAFHWRFWVGRNWVLVSNRSESASRGLEDNLAASILRALEDGLEFSEEVRWPVFTNPAVPGNDAAGAADVLAAVADSLAGRNVVALGLVPDGAERASVLQALTGHLGTAAVSFPRTLAALASDPVAKRDLWGALKAAAKK
ncbi:hypothetical protein SAMN05216203_2580 [Marinobacter daqiaonensis]|uniref:2-isopropylmalate synthase n=1 Tax=Marinobacter daqiaonensis TaxID=650891 RepID=A0A1I6J2C4_9GAMM|nr:hypothetical protein [Marinobacter daqiaonensis]SFR73079.1 hypothetical protein SAMN05216203_2580 [Marinobacter daqiaonensis]